MKQKSFSTKALMLTGVLSCVLISLVSSASPIPSKDSSAKKGARKEAYEKCVEQTLSGDVKDSFNQCRKDNKVKAVKGLDKKRCIKDVPADQRKALIECVQAELASK